MDFCNTQSRWNGSSPSLNKTVGLSINFYDVISSKEAHYVVFNTKNATKCVPEITGIPSKKSKCILPCPESDEENPKPEHYELLPLTICSKHGNSSFLPLDCVAKLPEYTLTTRVIPALKTVHSFDDCVLEFPNPPPISSSQEQLFRRNDFINKCYQCIADLSLSKSVYMYRDYLFCCPSCRYKACVTHYWYKKVMNIVDDDDDEEEEKRKKKERSETAPENDNSEMEGGVIFFI